MGHLGSPGPARVSVSDLAQRPAVTYLLPQVQAAIHPRLEHLYLGPAAGRTGKYLPTALSPKTGQTWPVCSHPGNGAPRGGSQGSAAQEPWSVCCPQLPYARQRTLISALNQPC